MEVDKTRFGFAIAAATIFCTISLDTVESNMADHHYEATNVLYRLARKHTFMQHTLFGMSGY